MFPLRTCSPHPYPDQVREPGGYCTTTSYSSTLEYSSTSSYCSTPGRGGGDTVCIHTPTSRVLTCSYSTTLVEYQPARQGDTGWDNGRHNSTDRELPPGASESAAALACCLSPPKAKHCFFVRSTLWLLYFPHTRTHRAPTTYSSTPRLLFLSSRSERGAGWIRD